MLTVALDGAPAREIAIEAPGLYELAEHAGHQEHSLALGAQPGVLVYALSFAAGVP